MFKLQSLLRLHRRIGIVSALFVILLSFSGLILHHSPALNLDNQFISSSRLLSWYEIEVPTIKIQYRAGQHGVRLIAEAIYFDSDRLPGSFSDLKGFVATEFGYVAATSNQLLLLTDTGEVIEVLGRVNLLPTGISRIGRDAAGRLVLQTAMGIIDADLDGLRWTPSTSPASELSWSDSTAPQAQLSARIRADYAASLVSWERLLLDIHSGRILGSLGVVLVDLMALLFMLMAASGVWIWSRRRN
ncbi:MAG: PepSY domain-containing protein [Pseudomonadales bacterium]|nr:PepSY domain-containing protein [Pseudomonadales bacterium]